MVVGPVGHEGLEYDAVATLSAGRVDVAVTPREAGVVRFVVDDRELLRHVGTLVDDLEQRLRID